jgi:hypothetical protein
MQGETFLEANSYLFNNADTKCLPNYPESDEATIANLAKFLIENVKE